MVLLYRELLGREPNQDEIAHQQAQAAAWQDILVAIVHSAEYAQRIPDIPAPPANVVNVHAPGLEAFGHPAGSRSADSVAEIGRDGWVFLVGGTNEVLSQRTGSFALEPGWTEQWARVMATRTRQSAELGIECLTVLVPDKVTVVGHLLTDPPDADFVTPALDLVGRHPNIVFPRDELAAVPGGAYMRTDTHLTLEGNRALAAAVGSVVGADLASATDSAGIVSVAAGDLGARFSPPVVELVTVKGDWGTARVVEDSAPATLALGRHVGIRQVLVNDAPTDRRRVLVFGDSYATASLHYQGLIWWLAQAFAEVHFVWVPFGWDLSYVEEVAPDLVISEGAERFAARAPDEQVDTRALVAAVDA